MDKTLGQDDIDAMFAQAMASISQEDTAPEAGTPLEAYNFSRAGQISNEQMKAITTVNDLFARNLMHTVGASLRTRFMVNLVSGEQMAYAEFLGRLNDPTYVCSIRLEPLGAIGLLELDLALAPPIVDLLLGGTGKTEPTRQLTDIEELIIASVVQMIVKELNVAWAPVGLSFNFEKRESAAQMARVMSAGEKTLCVCFEVKMPGAQGVMNICLPAVVLNTILRQLITERDKPRRSSLDVRMRVRELLGQSTVGTVLQFPSVRLKAREIAALTEGSVLRLPLPRHSAAELRVGGLTYGRARPVRMGEHRGARMEPHDLADGNDGSASQLVQ
jgi:flagellar motor switch protein FliM